MPLPELLGSLIGSLSEPLIMPAEDERDGYVPNVVHSCGGLVHNNNLIILYAVSDSPTSVSVLPLDELLARLSTCRQENIGYRLS